VAAPPSARASYHIYQQAAAGAASSRDLY